MTQPDMQDWIDAQDWQAIFAAVQRDVAEAINELNQERRVHREWLWEPMI